MTRTTWSANRVRSCLIDDSYVEALMVPFRDSLTGRLDSFHPGHAGLFVRHVELSALSNYLTYADFAAQRFHPRPWSSSISGTFHGSPQFPVEVVTSSFGRPSNEQIFVGNTGAKADPIRIADAQRAIDTFLAHAVGAANLPADRILFAVDGMRPYIYDARTRQLA